MAELTDGPWQQAFWVTVADAVSKSNFRRGDPGWARYRDFEFDLHAQLRRGLPAGWPAADDAPARVADRPRFVGAFAAIGNLDAANLPKSVADAAEGVVYRTDAQLWACLPVLLRRSPRRPQSWVAFAHVAGGAAEQIAAAAELARQLVAVADDDRPPS